MPILDKVRIILDQITILISRSDPSLARRVSNSMAMSLLQQLVAIKTMMFKIVQDSCHILCHYDEQNHHHGHHLGQVLGPVLGGLNLQATGRTLPHDEDPEVVHNKPGCCIHCKIKHIRSELYLRVRRVLPHFSQLQRWFLLYYLDHSVDHHIDHHHQHHFNHQTSWWWWVHVLDLERAGAPRSQRGDAPDDQEQGNQVHDMCLVFWWWSLLVILVLFIFIYMLLDEL